MNVKSLTLIAGSSLVFLLFLAFSLAMVREIAIRLRTGFNRNLQSRCYGFLTSDSHQNKIDIHSLAKRFGPGVLAPVLERFATSNSPDRGFLSRLYEESGTIGYLGKILRSSPKWYVRAQAANHLGKSGCLSAVQFLADGLLDPDEDLVHVKVACAQALESIGDPAAIPQLIKAFGTGNYYVAASASTALASFGHTVTQKLIDALRSTSQQARNEQNKATMPASSDLFVRSWIIRTLGSTADSQAFTAMIEVLSSPEAEERIAAIDALGKIKDKRSFQPLGERLLYDPAPAVRTAAAKALSLFNDTRAIDLLVRAVSDPDNDTGINAVNALEMFGQQAVEPLRQVLSRGRPEVCCKAAEALERMGLVHGAIEHLIDSDKNERLRAQTTLEEIASAGALETIIGTLNHEDFRIRARLCTILGRNRLDGVEDALLERLGDSMWPVQTAALEALQQMPLSDDAMLEKIVPLLKSETEEIRQAAIRCMMRVQANTISRYVGELSSSMVDRNREIRTTAMYLLGSTKTTEAIQALAKRMSTGDVQDRIALCRALGKTEKKEALAGLLDALCDSELEVRDTAAFAIGEFTDPKAIPALLGVLDNISPLTLAQVLWKISHSTSVDCSDEIMGSSAVQAHSVHIRYLAFAGDTRANRLVKVHLESTEPLLLKDALDVCGIIDARENIPRILELLKSEDAAVCECAVRALGNLCAKEAVEPFLDLPKSIYKGMIGTILIAMGKIGRENTSDLIAPFLDNKNEKVEAAAIIALGLLSKENTFEAIVSRMANPIKENSVNSLLIHEPPAIQETFHSNINAFLPGKREKGESLSESYRIALEMHTDAGVRAQAARAMGWFDKSGIAPLRKALSEDPERHVRSNALDSLAKLLPPDEAVAAARKALSDPSVLVKCKAIGTTWKFLDALTIPVAS